MNPWTDAEFLHAMGVKPDSWPEESASRTTCCLDETPLITLQEAVTVAALETADAYRTTMRRWRAAYFALLGVVILFGIALYEGVI